jgi:hypothetical protein
MSALQLGQRVQFTDRLVRVSIGDKLLPDALNLMNVSRTRGGRTWNGLDWKLWVPATFAKEHLHKGLCMISPLPTVGGPARGFIVQHSTLQQGGTHYSGHDAGETCWLDHGTTRAYKVAFSMHRNPIHVLPEHITVLPEPSGE